MTQIDLFEELTGAASAAPNISNLRALAEEAVKLEWHLAKIEQMQKETQQRLNQIKHEDLPDTMAQAGVNTLELSDGTEIEIKDFCSGSLPKEEGKREQAVNWLVEHGGEALIKCDVTAHFTRNQHNQAMDLAEQLKAQGLSVKNELSVHPQTLQAFAREKMRNGEAVDLETLGLYAGRVAKIKLAGGK